MRGDNPTDTENLVAAAIADAEEIGESPVGECPAQKPRLLIENTNPHRTIAALRDILKALLVFMIAAYQFVSLATKYSEAP